MRLKIYVFLLLMSIPTWANSECKEVRLDATGYPLHNYPIFDQGNLPICEAMSTAPAIDSARFYNDGKVRRPPVTSPIALATRIAGRIRDYSTINGPSAGVLIEFTPRAGICDNDQITNQLTANINTNYCSEIKEFLTSVNLANNQAAAAGNSSCGFREPNSNNLDAVKLIAHLTKTDADLKSVQRKMDQLCGSPLIKPNIKPATTEYWFDKPFNTQASHKQRKAALKAAMDRALDLDNPVPPIVRYCNNFLFDSKAKSGIAPETGNMKNCTYTDNKGKELRGNHTSIVAGRRPSKNGRSCEYLIRNSYGTSCNQYDKKWECDRTKGGQPCPAGEVCGGQTWVDEETFLNNTQDVLYVEAN